MIYGCERCALDKEMTPCHVHQARSAITSAGSFHCLATDG